MTQWLGVNHLRWRLPLTVDETKQRFGPPQATEAGRPSPAALPSALCSCDSWIPETAFPPSPPTRSFSSYVSSSSPDNAQSSFEIGTISHKLCQSAQTNISAQDTETNLLTHQFSKKPVALAFCTSSTTPSPLHLKISVAAKFSL